MFGELLKHLLGGCLDFIRRYFMESSGKSPFVAEWVTDTRESFAPEHVSGVHKNFRAVVFNGFDHRGTVIDVQMSRAACATKAGWTWHATMFREFFAVEKPSVTDAKFAAYHAPVRHVK